MSAATRIEHIWKIKDISPTEKFILTVLVNEYGGGFWWDEAIHLAMDTTGYGLNTVRASLSSLIEKGYVEYNSDEESGYIPIPHRRFVVDEARRIIKAAQMLWPKTKRDIWGTHSGVYFIKHPHSGLHKIGFTDHSLVSRISHIAALEKAHLQPVLIIYTREPRTLEGHLHKLLDRKQVHGEWFNLDARDFEYIKSLAGVES